MMRRLVQLAAGTVAATTIAACGSGGHSAVKPITQQLPASPTDSPTSPAAVASSAPATRVVGSPVLDATFVSAAHGWALTTGTLYETIDGGHQWRPVRLPHSAITHVRFVDATVGYVWDANGRLWLTRDDTRTWGRAGLDQVDSLEASGSSVWALAGPLPGPRVFRSSDASTRWDELGLSPNRGGELLPHGDVVYVLGEQGAGPIAPSYDVYIAGRKAGSHRPLPCAHPPRLVPQSPMTVSTDGSLFLVCDVEPTNVPAEQLAYTSNDRGATWTPVTPPPMPMAGVAATRGARFGWDRDLWVLRDGQWRRSLSGPTTSADSDLAGFALAGFQDDSHGVALTRTGQLYLTSDTGRHWRRASLPTRLPVNDCRAADLRVAGGRQGAGSAGLAHADIDITNVGSSACALASPDDLAVLDRTGSPLPLEVGGLDVAAGASAVRLPAHGRASLTLSWQNWCGPRSSPLRVRLDFGAGSVTGSFDGPPDYNLWPSCITRSKKSILQVLAPYTTP